ncbi:MAG: nucleoside triphosphate pyrophosphohydrolase [Armatimonadetes bacterium]|nr:nucleoside triphosphate pyrophosphohydrolase [Armatimonadota bacterium]MDE2207084.1 nucleoside triphosphate pyrophosphohydrolase [Armatimonadota bacterium]
MGAITLVGLGPGSGDWLTRGAEKALRLAGDPGATGRKLLLRTARHPVVSLIRDWGLVFETFDELYARHSTFAEVYRAISASLVQAAADCHVTYAVPGSPLLGEVAVAEVRALSAERGIPVEIVPASSFWEAALMAAGCDLPDGCDIRDAHSLQANCVADDFGLAPGADPDTTRPMLIFQVYDTALASEVKLALMRWYSDSHRVAVLQGAGASDHPVVEWGPLYQLDRRPFDHLTAVLVPAVIAQDRKPGFRDLAGVMARLRSPKGCPWDLEQDHASLREYLIEETYEVLDAIDSDDAEAMKEELGDLALQVVFHAQLASESGRFTLDDVMAEIVAKLVRRHPHVFGALTVSGSDEVLTNWTRIKREEKRASDLPAASVMTGIASSLPALQHAQKVSERAARAGFEWSDIAGVWEKVEEELAELKEAVNLGSQEETAAELGDLLFAVIQIARWRHISAEMALRDMVHRFTGRFRWMEAEAARRGDALEALSPTSWDELWRAAKQAESTSADRAGQVAG